MQKELFYVAASRGRESVEVITSDKQRLRETVAQSTMRKSASELARRARAGLQRGQRPGLAAALVLMRRAAQFATAVPRRVLGEPPRSLLQLPRKERMREHGLSR